MESPAPETNKMAITSMALALVTWVIGGLGSCGILFLFPPFAICPGLIFLGGNIVAVIIGYLGRNQIHDSDGAQTGEGIATTGLMLGSAGIFIVVLPVVFFIVVIIVVAVLALTGPAVGNVYPSVIDAI